ncbi:MAG: hypothetical protein RLZZ511_4121 [Cyanobacteriota bacterium]
MEKSNEERKAMILDALNERDMTPKSLADALGRGLTTVKEWIEGKAIPEMTPLETKQFCEVMGWTLDQMIEAFPGQSKRRAAIKAHQAALSNARDRSASESSKKKNAQGTP